jgi:hypothetical protein
MTALASAVMVIGENLLCGLLSPEVSGWVCTYQNAIEGVFAILTIVTLVAGLLAARFNGQLDAHASNRWWTDSFSSRAPPGALQQNVHLLKPIALAAFWIDEPHVRLGAWVDSKSGNFRALSYPGRG